MIGSTRTQKGPSFGSRVTRRPLKGRLLIISFFVAVVVGSSGCPQPPKHYNAPSLGSRWPQISELPDEAVAPALRQMAAWYLHFVDQIGNLELYNLPFQLGDRPDFAVISLAELARIRLTPGQADTLIAFVRQAAGTRMAPARPLSGRSSSFGGVPWPPDWDDGGRHHRNERARIADTSAIGAIVRAGLSPGSIARRGSRESALASLVPRVLEAFQGDTIVDTSDPWSYRPLIRRIYFKNQSPPPCPQNDVVCDAAYNPFTPDTSVAALVHYPWFSADALRDSVTLPNTLAALLLSEYEKLRRAIPDTLRVYMEEWPLVLASSSANGSLLWVEAVPGPGRPRGIYVSPVLVRGVFLKATSSFHELIPTWKEIKDLPGDIGPPGRPMYRNANDMRSVLDVTLGNFLGAFHFALAHEMGHVFPAKGGTERNESVADCYGAALLLRAGVRVQPGILESMGAQSIAEGSAAVLWGTTTFADTAALRRRLDAIIRWAEQRDPKVIEAECEQL